MPSTNCQVLVCSALCTVHLKKLWLQRAHDSPGHEKFGDDKEAAGRGTGTGESQPDSVPYPASPKPRLDRHRHEAVNVDWESWSPPGPRVLAAAPFFFFDECPESKSCVIHCIDWQQLGDHCYVSLIPVVLKSIATF